MSNPGPSTNSNQVREKDNLFKNSKLPTPPPDPRKEQQKIPSDKDQELLDYITSLHQRSFARSDSVFGPAVAVEEAFDHLEKLYKLMDQFLTLRQQNARLQRRIRDLEYLRNLEKMNRKVEMNLDREIIPNVEEETALAENIFEVALAMGNKEDKHKLSNHSRLRQSLSRKQRERRTSLSTEDNKNVGEDVIRSRRASASSQYSKISHWTKVKAAFKWEKASNGVSDAKSHDSGLGGIQPVNYKSIHYLRVPSATDDQGTSPGDSGAADGSSPASISTTSSLENLPEQGDDERYFPIDKIITDVKDRRPSSESLKKKKKINTQDKRKVSARKHTLSNKSDDIKIADVSFDSCNEDVFEAEEKDPTIPIRIKEKYKQILNEEKYQLSNKPETETDHFSKWDKIKKVFLNHSNSPEDTHRIKDDDTNEYFFKFGEYATENNNDTMKIQNEIQKNYQQLQKRLSQEFQVKLKEWEKMKTHSPNVPGTLSNFSEEQKDEAFIKKMEEWQRIKSHPSKLQAIEMMKQENLPPEFKKKLQEWQRMKKTSKEEAISPSPNASPKRKLSEWSKWKPLNQSTDSKAPFAEELPNKLEENVGIIPNSPLRISKKMKDPNQKDIHWLEKELNKIEKEKQRLERERQKFIEREERLNKLRKSVMGNDEKKEIFIHTPSGFHRFEGISKQFTQKLYEWEKSQGIGPESSTIALLSSGLIPKSYFPEISGNLLSSCSVTLTRSKSDDSLMVNNPNEIISHQPSSLSLNHVEELEKERIDSAIDVFVQDPKPGAFIVEVEDIIEETASILEEKPREKLFPVYQRQPEDKIWLVKGNLDQRKREGKTLQGGQSTTTFEEEMLKSSEEKDHQNQIKQGAVKKKTRVKLKTYVLDSASDDTEEENDNGMRRGLRNTNRPKTCTITRYKQPLGESKTRLKKTKIKPDQLTYGKTNIQTEPHFGKILSTTHHDCSARAVLVETTKTLIKQSQNEKSEKTAEGKQNENMPLFQRRTSKINRPPTLPISPTLQRKTPKEISPCIRLMMNRYNQKVSEQEFHTLKSTSRSGSVSPVSWRSPLLNERRKIVTEKYLSELNKNNNGQVQKSASTSHIKQSHETSTLNDVKSDQEQIEKGKIIRSVSAGIIAKPTQDTKHHPKSLTVIINSEESTQSRLKKAREIFLSSSTPTEPISPPTRSGTKVVTYPCKNRLSQLSVESGSSESSAWEGMLLKSASAGMINIDADSFKQFDAAIHKDGYVSLPRSPKKLKSNFFLLNNKFSLSNIASKFRKVKMRRHKDGKSSKPMNTITALCRQSLVVDINSEISSQTNSEQSSRRNSVLPKDKVATDSRRYSSEDISPSSSNTKSINWVKKTKFFSKANQQ